MHREAEAIARKQTFLLIRYAMIVSTGAVSYLEVDAHSPALPVVCLVAVMLLSNIAIGQSSPFSFFDAWLQAPVLIADTAMISVALLLSRASQEFFLFFFFVLIMAAKLESLATLGIGAALIGFASFLISDPNAGWLSPALMRIPFLFAAGLFFGYVVLPERTGQMTPLKPRARRENSIPMRPLRQAPKSAEAA